METAARKTAGRRGIPTGPAAAAFMTAAALILAASHPAPAAGTGQAASAPFTLSLEELLGVTVTTPQKRQQRAAESSQSVSVLTAEQIRAAGVRSLPEALSLVPGVFVSQQDGNAWVVTIGGFGIDSFSNKLLVLIDGVTVYSTLLGNVEWDQLPVTLGEIRRIEVVRGPGGVIYGANAVNGVINIITQRPGWEGGRRLRLGLGTQGVLNTFATAGFAGSSGGLSGRLSMGYDEDNGTGAAAGDLIGDYQKLATLAARVQADLGPNATLSVDGRYRGGEFLTSTSGIAPVVRRKTGHNIFRVRADFGPDNGPGSFVQLFGRRQLLYDEESQAWDQREDSRTLDLEFQHTVPLGRGGAHHLTLGGGYRDITDEHEILLGGEQAYTVGNLYLHESWSATPRLHLDLGIKWEDVDLVDPTAPWSVGGAYSLGSDQVLRFMVSTSYRSPTLLESYQNILVSFPGGSLTLGGNDTLKPERSFTVEGGYRGRIAPGLYLDLSASLKEYHDIIAQYEVTGPPDQVFNFRNDGDADGATADVGLEVYPAPSLHVKAVYGMVDLDFDGAAAADQYRTDPDSFGRVDIRYRPSGSTLVNMAGRYKGEQPGPVVEERWYLDLHLAVNLADADGAVELGLSGTNILKEDAATSARGEPEPRIYSAYLRYLF